MKIAVLGSSPIMLVAGRHLAGRGHDVTVFEERPQIGGAWIAPGLCGLKHRHANLIVAYNDDDLRALESWKDFLRGEMNMAFEPVPHHLINMSTAYHTSFDPDFADAYAALPATVSHVRVETVTVEGEGLKVNGQDFDHLLLPAFCSIETFTVNGIPHVFAFDEATSLHAICEDHKNMLDYVYVEGDANVFDRYFKDMESGIFVARVQRAAKALPRDRLKEELERNFRLRDIAEYTSHYRTPARFDEFRTLESLSGGRIRVLDTRQFCWGLKDITGLEGLGN
jgi:hypothetical protein